MKIYCEYCGAQFDIETNHECPECGAAFDKNKYAFELQEQKKKRTLLKACYRQSRTWKEKGWNRTQESRNSPYKSTNSIYTQ